MRKQHDNELDRLFAEKLGNFKAEPPDKVWRTIAAGLITGAASTTVWSTVTKPIIWSLSLMTMVFIITTSNYKPEEQLYTNQNLVTREHIAHLPVLSIENIEIDNQYETHTPIQNDYNSEINIPDKLNPPELYIAEATLSDNNSNIVDQPSLISTIDHGLIPVNSEAYTLSYLSGLELRSLDDYIRKPWMYLSLNSGPDAFSFNNSNIDFDSWGSNYGLGVSMHVSEFYFMTGLNLLNITQKNSYVYSQNEYLQVGEYSVVDSISFEIIGYDSLGRPIWEPEYYVSTHPQYDSVPVSYSTYSLDKYRFFEIPMVIGLQKDIKRFTLYAQTGFTYTFYLNSNELSRNLFEEHSGVITQSWIPQSEQRLNNFWSFSFAMGVYYNTNRNIAFGIEPTYRYYLEPFFSGYNIDQRTPVSYGLRLRLLYKL